MQLILFTYLTFIIDNIIIMISYYNFVGLIDIIVCQLSRTFYIRFRSSIYYYLTNRLGHPCRCIDIFRVLIKIYVMNDK